MSEPPGDCRFVARALARRSVWGLRNGRGWLEPDGEGRVSLWSCPLAAAAAERDGRGVLHPVPLGELLRALLDGFGDGVRIAADRSRGAGREVEPDALCAELLAAMPRELAAELLAGLRSRRAR